MTETEKRGRKRDRQIGRQNKREGRRKLERDRDSRTNPHNNKKQKNT